MEMPQAKSKSKHKGRLGKGKHSLEALKRAIQACGGKQIDLARRMKVSPQSVDYWLSTDETKRSCISGERAVLIEYVTKGEVTRQEIRPDLYAPMEEYYDEVAEG